MKKIFLFVIILHTHVYSQNGTELDLENNCQNSSEGIKSFPITFEDLGIRMKIPSGVTILNDDELGRQIVFSIYGIADELMPVPTITASLSLLNSNKKTMDQYYIMEKEFAQESLKNSEEVKLGVGKINSSTFKYIELHELNDYGKKVYSMLVFIENKMHDTYYIARINVIENTEYESSLCKLKFILNSLNFIE